MFHPGWNYTELPGCQLDHLIIEFQLQPAVHDQKKLILLGVRVADKLAFQLGDFGQMTAIQLSHHPR